ncbi:response regulator [Virgisporangium ochraceum]|uniref:Response regulator n=2 Tax=Virgisporangium ochraceum TaxID=65505 RepID=A0A8J4E956_9ACTN|nr:response regulator [Virgisporangium ochraceum]
MSERSERGSPVAARVLLVDDRKDNLLALEAIMQGLPVQTVAAHSGEEALKHLLVEDFALILLDAQMPDMDGFETARHIKRRERTRHVPIIFLTAADRDSHLAMRGYAVGAVDYLTKPFDPWVLRAKVSVFVELWAKNEQLQAQGEAARVRDNAMRAAGVAVGEALTALNSTETTGGELLPAQLERALAALDRAQRHLGI